MFSILRNLKKKYIAMRGFHTKEHLLVIESDDWGSIRMPSYETFVRLQKMGDNPEKDAFLSCDCLETEDELNDLFSVLRAVKDSVGNPAVITANFAMANPDFDSIDYVNGRYFYEPFYKTYEKHEKRKNNLSLIKRAYNEKIFVPQLHCREHLNVKRWMRDLASLEPNVVLAFNEKTFGIGGSFSYKNVFGYMDAFNYDTKEEALSLVEILREASEIFKSTFGFSSKTFVASCFVWGNCLEKHMCRFGISGIQSSEWQNVPRLKEGTIKMKRKIHFTGQKGKFGQIFSVRNCSYEPAYKQNPKECMEKCLSQIEYAFNNNKPAVINSHRFNYINSINPQNAESNLVFLNELLRNVVQRYPDIRFVSSDELLGIMKG